MPTYSVKVEFWVQAKDDTEAFENMVEELRHAFPYQSGIDWVAESEVELVGTGDA